MTFCPEDTVNYNEIPIDHYELTVSPKPIEVQILDLEKIYGDELSADALLSYNKTELAEGDALHITLTAADTGGTAET